MTKETTQAVTKARPGKVQVHSNALGDLILVQDERGKLQRIETEITLPPNAVVQMPAKTTWNAEKGIWEGWSKDRKTGKFDMVKKDAPTGYISSTGVIMGNVVAGLTHRFPPEITIFGKTVENPYVCNDEDGCPVSVTVLVEVSGMTPLGKFLTIPHQVTLNLDILRRQSFAKIAEGDGGANAVRIGLRSTPPEGCETWAKYPIDSQVAFYCNVADPKCLGAWSDHLTVAVTAGRRAQTIALRNAMQRHPAFPLGKYARWDENCEAWKMPVVGWLKDPTELDRAIGKVAEMADDIAGVTDVATENKEDEKPPAHPDDAEQTPESAVGETTVGKGTGTVFNRFDDEGE